MSDSGSSVPERVVRFRALHGSGCFLLPNPWDVGTARYLAHLGFPALATTSAGLAFARGLPDTVGAIARDVMLEHVREVVSATELPVNADFQTGYADEPEGVALNVARCIRTGIAGLSIEDATGDAAAPLHAFELAVERVRAARRAIDSCGIPVVLTARCEAWLVRHAEPARTALERLEAFAEAGAECLYAPGVRDPATIAAIVKAVAPRAVNVLVSAPLPELSLTRLAELGVRRVSLGSALARVAWGAFMRAARRLSEDGSFEALAGAASFDELDQLFGERR